jgi:hypothetical protein
MGLGLGMVVAGAVIGLLLALFGVRMLSTGRAPGPTVRAFRDVRDAGMYHLLFGVALIVLAVGSGLPGGGVFAGASAVVAVGLAGFAIIRHRPRGRDTADR